MRPARHPHQVVVDPRQDACGDGRRSVAMQELGANRQRLVVPARIDVRRQDVVQLRQLPIWEHAQRLQGRAGRRVPDFTQDARAALFRSQLVQPSQRKIRKTCRGQRRRVDERPQYGHHGRAGESGPLILEQRGLSFVRQLEKRRSELFTQTIARRCRRAGDPGSGRRPDSTRHDRIMARARADFSGNAASRISVYVALAAFTRSVRRSSSVDGIIRPFVDACLSRPQLRMLLVHRQNRQCSKVVLADWLVGRPKPGLQ